MNTRPLDWFDNVEARIHQWPGLNWLTAMLYVSNCEEAMKFYEKAFRFVTIFEMPDDSGSPVFIRMRSKSRYCLVHFDSSVFLCQRM